MPVSEGRTYPVIDVNFHDGDSGRAVLDLGFGITKRIHFRLRGVDTPELRGETRAAARAATVASLEYVDVLRQVYCDTFERAGREIKGKYGRWLVDFDRADRPDTLVHTLLANGHGRPYDGGRR